jgi:RimJ/RimL family protein N-acetyltransferase
MKHLVLNASDAVCDWVYRQLDEKYTNLTNCTGVGIADHNKRLIAGVVYSHYDGEHDIMMTVAASTHRWLSRNILYALFAYPFLDLNCTRVTAVTAKKNKKARKFLEGLGFKLEGRLRRKYGKTDGLIYGMLKQECKWIEHGKK